MSTGECLYQVQGLVNKLDNNKDASENKLPESVLLLEHGEWSNADLRVRIGDGFS